MRLMIFEPVYAGHRLHYVRMLVQAARTILTDVTVVLSQDAPQSAEFQTHLQPLAGQFALDAVGTSNAPTPTRIHRLKLRLLRAAIRRHRPDHIWIPYADGLTQLLGIARLLGRSPIPRGVEVEALLMRGAFAYADSPWRNPFQARAWLAATTLAPWRVVHILDPIPFAAIQRRGGSLARRSRIIPEPVESIQDVGRPNARRKLGIPETGRYLGCAGGIDRRKGVDLLIRAFAAAKLADDDRLLLVGKIEAPVRRMLDGEFSSLVHAGRIIVFDRYASAEEFALGLCAVDLVCTAYPGHIGSSGIVVRAAAAGRAVLGSDYGWVGMVIPRFGLGTTCRVQNHQAFAAALPKALEQSVGFTLPPAGQRFVQFHTADNYRAHWSVRLRQRLGLSPITDLRSWDWVLEANSSPAT